MNLHESNPRISPCIFAKNKFLIFVIDHFFCSSGLDKITKKATEELGNEAQKIGEELQKAAIFSLFLL